MRSEEKQNISEKQRTGFGPQETEDAYIARKLTKRESNYAMQEDLVRQMNVSNLLGNFLGQADGG